MRSSEQLGSSKRRYSSEGMVYIDRPQRWWLFADRPLWLRLGAVALTLLALGSTVRFVATSTSGDRLERLVAENARLREINRSFEANLLNLLNRLAEQEARTNQLAIVAGITEESVRVDGTGDDAPPGIGGAFNPGDQIPDLPTLESRATVVTQRLDDVTHGLTERELRISARPSLSPAKGIVTSGYGERSDPLTGNTAFHRGIDISAPPGNLVFATADGVVTRAGRQGNFGKTIYIAHGFGYATRYAHLSTIDVKPGDRVGRGLPIGKVGRSGRATGYHVHYEVHQHGRSRNPLQHILD